MEDRQVQFDIIIPFCLQVDRLISCLISIRRYSKDYRIILINNGYNGSRLNEVLNELSNHPFLLVTNKQNLGFVKATNQGIRRAIAPYVVLLNDDTEAVPGWLEALKKGFEYNNSVGAVGPLTTTPDSWQGTYKPKSDYMLLEGTSMLAFFCTMFKRQVFQAVGLLDEDFGVGFGDDDNYCQRMTYFGFNMCLCGTIRIPHHHRSTFKELYTQEEIANMQSKAIRLMHRKKEALEL